MFSYLPNEFIYWEQLPEDVHNILKDRLLTTLSDLAKTDGLQKPKGWLCKVKTSFSGDNALLQTPLIHDNVVWGPFNRMLSNDNYPLQSKPRTSRISHIWLNFYHPGFYQEIHSHTHSTFSGIYLVDLKEPNKTVFHSSLSNVADITVQSLNTDFIQEGSVILFPSYLQHYVLPAEQDRVTLSFNIKSHYGE